MLSSFLHAAGVSDILPAFCTGLFTAHLDFVGNNQTLLANARRCEVYATLDRAKESQRVKDRMLLGGKGNARSMECWLRVHQSCNVDWSHLMSTSLKFRVPSGYRLFNSKQPCAKHTPTSQCNIATFVQHQSSKAHTGNSMGHWFLNLLLLDTRSIDLNVRLIGNASKAAFVPAGSRGRHSRPPSTPTSEQSHTPSDTDSDFTPAGPAPKQPCLGSSHVSLASHSPLQATAALIHSQPVLAAEAASQQRRASACLSVSAPSSVPEEQANPDFCPNLPINSAVKLELGSFGLAASQPDALFLAPTASPADELPPTAAAAAAAAVPLLTGNKTEHSPPSAQAVAAPLKVQSAAVPQLIEICFAQSSASRIALSASGRGSKADVLADAVNQNRYHSCQQAEASGGKAPFHCKPGGPDKGQPSGQQAEATKGSRPLHSISTGPPKWQAVTGSQLQAPSLDPPVAPRGLNGPLLSHPRKRKTPDASYTASQLQHRLPNKDSSSSAVKTQIIDRVKRVKTETHAERVMSGSFDCIDLTQSELQPQPHVSSGSSPDSLDVMFKKVNCTLGDKAISQEQMRLLQGAVDNVDELKGLKRKQLNFVLESIGKLETFQMIVIRHYLTESQSTS